MVRVSKAMAAVVAAGALTMASAEALTAMSDGGSGESDSYGGGGDVDSQQR